MPPRSPQASEMRSAISDEIPALPFRACPQGNKKESYRDALGVDLKGASYRFTRL
jgi:hypothetical protein